MKHYQTIFLFELIFLTSILVMTGCSSGSLTMVSSSPTELIAKVINLQGGSYQPVSIEIEVGETVRWENNCCLGCSVTSDTGLFDSGELNRGQSFSFTFLNPGIYPYHCIKIEDMKGTIIVN